MTQKEIISSAIVLLRQVLFKFHAELSPQHLKAMNGAIRLLMRHCH